MGSTPARVDPAAPATAPPPRAAAGICPDCGSSRAPGARYCEVCRYDHEQGAATLHVMQTASAGRAEAPAAATATTSVPRPTSRRWVVVVSVDPQQASEHAVKDCPAARPLQRFPLDLAETLIGRRSERRGIYPELDLADAGVSHRHLLLLRQQDCSFAALDLGSSNGTRLNDSELQPGVSVPLAASDELRLGIWTRITIEEK